MEMARHGWVRSYHTSAGPLTPESRGLIPASARVSSAGRARTRSAEAADDRNPARGSAAASRRFVAPFAVVCLVAGAMAALAARERVAAAIPFVEPAYAAIGLPVNARGLAIQEVHARLGETGEKKYLVIEGWIANLRATQTISPDLRIALRGSNGEDLYVWTTRAPRRRLERAERVKFAARLEAPPEAAKDAIVDFVDAGKKPTLGAEGS